MPPKRSTRRGAAAQSPRRATTRATRAAPTPTPPRQVSENGDDHARAQQSNEDSQSQVEESADERDTGEGHPEVDETRSDSAAPSEPAVATPRRRPGRPPKVRPPGWDTPDPDANDASESGMISRRGRGRGRLGGWRGGQRGRGKKGSSIPVSRPPLDEDGNEMEVENDDVVQPDHSEGEKKIDRDGLLQDGRQYRVRTFTIIGRAKRLYMLSTEPARCTGFRDSYLFFNKHKLLYKIILGEEEKKDLIERDILPHSYKGRTIGVVTARSVYREFGSKIVVGGRKVIDDYNPDDARARGDVEGELADPYDRLPEKGQEYNRNQYVAWHGASNVYHSNAPQGPLALGSLAGKKRGAITSANWMYEHAWESSRFNSSLAAARCQSHHGVYDTHTNLMCFPQIMQPTHAVWDQVNDGPAASGPPAKKRNLGTVNDDRLDLTNGVPSQDADNELAPTIHFPEESGLIKPSPFLSRNYIVVDTELITPQHASWAPPDYRNRLYPSDAVLEPEDVYDFDCVTDAGLWRRGLPTLSEDILATFPLDAREAYVRERQVQGEWQEMWRDPGACRRPKIGISSMSGG